MCQLISKPLWLPLLIINILSGLYCTFFVVTGGLELVTMKKLRCYDQRPRVVMSTNQVERKRGQSGIVCERRLVTRFAHSVYCAWSCPMCVRAAKWEHDHLYHACRCQCHVMSWVCYVICLWCVSVLDYHLLGRLFVEFFSSENTHILLRSDIC